MKRTVLFVYDHEYPDLWKDGLFGALQLLSFDYKIVICNLRMENIHATDDADFILGWGAFNSKVDITLQNLHNSTPKGLCIAGVAAPPVGMEKYRVLFYETDWYKPTIETHSYIVKAFGVNTKIYREKKMRKIWDYLTVGAFSTWKRQEYLLNKHGMKLAIGEIQKGNPRESLGIVARLLAGNVMISDMVTPEKLCEFYNMSKKVYIPADIFGGGERAVLESRACGVDVEVEDDNPKLKELLNCSLPTEKDYAERLKEGIETCLRV